MSLEKMPLVSVGIPTFNRPEGLKRTLELITNQTYRNLEIIISDNATEGDSIESVMEPFLKSDSRIKFYKQEINKGASYNFRFVLGQSSGHYFMWAADDDYWEASTIEFYLAKIFENAAFFCSYSIKAGSCIFIADDLPILNGSKKADQIKAFLLSPCPSMMYGIFIRENLVSIYTEDFNFDWGDCFFLIKYIHFFGYKTIKTNERLYMAGVEDSSYQVKVANKKYLNPWIYFFKSFRYIFPSGLKSIELNLRFCINAWKNRSLLSREF